MIMRFLFWLSISSCVVNAFYILNNYTAFPEFIAATSIFFNNETDETLIEKCRIAEDALRIFIYPIPEEAGITSTDNVLLHFTMETHFYKYLKSQQKRVVVVPSPDTANAFFVDHHMLHLSAEHGKEGCGKVDHHLRTIADAVINKMPYYNKSGGADHFFVSIFDHGPFCEHVCQNDRQFSSSITATMLRLEGANFIGNYGMDGEDKGYAQSYSKSGMQCHRPGRDIVIPQIMGAHMLEYRQKFCYTGGLVRPLDSSFSGSYWGERAPMLSTMAKMRHIDYHLHSTEDFWFDITGGSSDTSMVTRSLYMYHICGFACWSNRLYHALGVSTIPIIVGTGMVQAFERFIDWRRISVKINRETWYSDSNRTLWRSKLRWHADDYRSKLKAFFKSHAANTDSNASFRSFGVLNTNPIPDSEHLQSMYDNEYRVMKNESDAAFLELFRTNIWQRKMAMERAIRWFDLSHRLDPSGYAAPTNGYRLLFLEIWCRVGGKQAKDEKLCSNKADFTARLEYD